MAAKRVEWSGAHLSGPKKKDEVSESNCMRDKNREAFLSKYPKVSIRSSLQNPAIHMVVSGVCLPWSFTEKRKKNGGLVGYEPFVQRSHFMGVRIGIIHPPMELYIKSG
jgi:hypothetical protein